MLEVPTVLLAITSPEPCVLRHSDIEVTLKDIVTNTHTQLQKGHTSELTQSCRSWRILFRGLGRISWEACKVGCSLKCFTFNTRTVQFVSLLHFLDREWDVEPSVWRWITGWRDFVVHRLSKTDSPFI